MIRALLVSCHSWSPANMLGIVPVLSTPNCLAIGSPHSRPQVSAKKKHPQDRIPTIEKRQVYNIYEAYNF